MAKAKSSNLGASNYRLFKDRAARWGVTLGGVLVLITLLLIFFYLLYVVEPIFRGVSIDDKRDFTIAKDGEVVALGIEEQSEIGYQFTDTGALSFFALQSSPGNDWQQGEILLREQVVPATPTSFTATQPQNNRYAYGTADGKAQVIEPKFRNRFVEGIRSTTPHIEYVNGHDLITVDPQGRALTQLAYEYDGESMLFAAVTADGTVVTNYLEATRNFLSGEVEMSENFNSLSLPGAVDQLEVTPNLRQLLIRQGNRLRIYDVSSSGKLSERQVIAVDRRLGDVTTMQLLAGASSILVGHSSGIVSQWFEVAEEEGRRYQFIREFKAADSAIEEIIPEYYRRTFYTVSAGGELGVFHTTSQADLYRGKPEQISAQRVVIDPRANTLLMYSDGQYHSFKLENEHPEVTWSGLWQEVWYEGYPEPEYVWQSTSGSDDFEPKFSLVPISFGTIKAAAYAMLFAVPIGLAAAVYTAYFMSPGVRKVVKPTVEIMEALPTVILGFLAGLWLAPVIENYLPGIVATIILVPSAIVFFALITSILPQRLRNQFTDGRAALVLLPLVVLVGWFSFSMSPIVEDWLFGGNVREYITNELGITFDQRNSLVVGIAMGFAVIPTIFSIAEDAVFSVPKHLSNGSLALGATTWQTLTKVVLLTASPGIFSAVMMGLGRAVGETMIVLMATGNTPIMDWNIFEGMRTLSANIAVEMPESEVGSSHYRILFLAAFVLFVFTFAFNTVAEVVRQRLRDKYSSM